MLLNEIFLCLFPGLGPKALLAILIASNSVFHRVVVLAIGKMSAVGLPISSAHQNGKGLSSGVCKCYCSVRWDSMSSLRLVLLWQQVDLTSWPPQGSQQTGNWSLSFCLCRLSGWCILLAFTGSLTFWQPDFSYMTYMGWTVLRVITIDTNLRVQCKEIF